MRFKILFSRVKRHVLLPFQDLNATEQFIQIIRLASSLMIILFGLIISILPYTKPQHLYMGKLNTLRADITSGVFTVLRDNLDSNGATDINNGVGLTTSEILVLTSYAFEQVQDIPAFILVTIYGRCDADYIASPSNSSENDLDSALDTDNIDVDGTSVVDEFDTTPDSGTFFVCQYRGPDYLFDYRTALSSVGLDIVLEYAYGSKASKQSTYETYIAKISLLKQRVLKLFYATVAIEFLISMLTIWYYYIKDRRLNVFMERFLAHLLSFLSLFVFIAGMIYSVSLLWINYSMREKIDKELLAFGFSYHVGVAWTTMMIVWLVFIGISCLVWSGLEWCVTNNGSFKVDDGETFLNDNTNTNISNNDDIFIKKNSSNTSQIGNTNTSYLKLLPNRQDGDDFNTSSTSSFTPVSAMGPANRTHYGHINTHLQDNNVDHPNYEGDSDFELQSIEFRSSGDSNRQRHCSGNTNNYEEEDDYDERYSIQKIIVPSSTIQF